MKKAIIVPNYLKEQSVSFSKIATEILINNGYEVSVLTEHEMPREGADFALVLGGDGTLLRACKKMCTVNTPVLGINFGSLGYLTECNPDTAIEAISSVVDGKYNIENRLLIEGEIVREDKVVCSFVALNEAAFYRSSLLKAFSLEIYINGALTQTAVGDGFIVATPTGSTSYNMSAGGPVLTPTADNMVLTPVSPKYYPRSSIVIGGGDTLEIKVSVNSITKVGNPSLQIDGENAIDIYDGDVVRIRKHNKYAKIIKVAERSFYQVLSKKLSKATYDL